MYQKIRHAIGSNLINMQGWTTKRKIIVFESDDWGTIRMPGRREREYLCSKYPRNFNNQTYDRVDNLANAEDLSALFDVLSRFQDFKGNHPIITANTIVANPDFEKIEREGFESYFYEPFPMTLERYSSHQGAFALWKEGMRAKVFHPQLHGREHLNIALWMNLLRKQEVSSLDAFYRGTWVMKSDSGRRLDVAFNYDTKEYQEVIRKYLQEGQAIFKSLFGYASKSYIAPSYTWDDDIEKILQNINIQILQGGLYQVVSPYFIEKTKHRLVRHHNGQKNVRGQLYLIRNTHFEPTLLKHVDLVNKCIGDIKRAFRWGKPAIISVHRLNFIGNLEEANRKETLNQLTLLLRQVLMKFPEVEFMTSDELGKEMLR